MKTLKTKLWAKVLAAILLFLCTAGIIGSAFLILKAEERGVYRKTQSEVWDTWKKEIQAKYSVHVMADYLGMGEDFPKSTNLQYAIAEGDLADAKTVKKGTKILAGDLKAEKIPEDAEKHVFIIGEISEYNAAWNLFDSAYISNSAYVDKEMPIEGFYVTRGYSDLYIKSGDMLYPVGMGLWWQSDQGINIWQEVSGKEVNLDSSGLLETIDLKERMKYPVYEEQATDLNLTDMSFRTACEDPNAKTYTVFSTVRDPLNAGNLFTGDFFNQAWIIITSAYLLRYWLIVLIVIGLAASLALFVFLMAAAGHTDDSGEVKLGRLAGAPADLVTIIAITVVSGALGVGASMWNPSYAPVSSILFLGLGGAAAYAAAILYCMYGAVNLKVGGWAGRSLIGRILKKTGQVIKEIWRGSDESSARLDLYGRTWLAFAGVALAGFLAIVLFRYHSRMLLICWTIAVLGLAFFLYTFLKQFSEIMTAGDALAAGKLDSKLETSHMLTDLRNHGNSLNAIGDGMSEAVAERMKSERMKTELITNVSHDIKTPLTSIINYTDLLKRENLQDPQAREYVEVLSRQSEKLKKLITDLIEASKASSGALTLEMEKVNAAVALVQAMGEFSDRFESSGIDVRLTNTADEGESMIMADSRYLWRVFDNLMSNICKYAQNGTRAYIDLLREEDHIKIIFRNTSREELHISGEELMERFVRGDSSRSSEGSGLGLSIAGSLTELMGGRMVISVDGDLFKTELTFPAI